ncbi:hypothetical protein M3Y97_01114000 [Aphelenchoides bicaudatus]|nr:hypothetical protein M3Y97_01114000 [Aphelenchoides bicaudatus]
MFIFKLLIFAVSVSKVAGRYCYACDDGSPRLYSYCTSPRQLQCNSYDQSCGTSTINGVMKKGCLYDTSGNPLKKSDGCVYPNSYTTICHCNTDMCNTEIPPSNPNGSPPNINQPVPIIWSGKNYTIKITTSSFLVILMMLFIITHC